MGLDKFCHYEFKSKECRYTGDADFCPGMLEYCEAIGNSINFPGSVKQKDQLEFCVTIVRESSGAWLVRDDAQDKDVWLAKSKVSITSPDGENAGPGDVVTIRLPEWLAIAKEFV